MGGDLGEEAAHIAGQFFRHERNRLPFESLLVKVYFHLHYGLEPDFDDLNNVRDLDGRKILVKNWERTAQGTGVWYTNNAQRVFLDREEFDVLVFGAGYVIPGLLGWLPRDEIENSPPVTQGDGGMALGFCHLVRSAGYLIHKFPLELRFQQTCNHFVEHSGIWEPELGEFTGAFECLGCGTFVYEKDARGTKPVADNSA